MIRLNEEAVDYALRGDWDWETGMNRDQLNDFETVRDYAMLVAYSNWNHVKNVGKRKDEFADAELAWVASVAGKRETRRLMGDHVLCQQDIFESRPYPDGTCWTTWSVDLHYPMPANQRNFLGEPFRSICRHSVHSGYPIPYRCFYSRNVANLFMAGRDISVTHVALGTTRVMRTHGMQGEVVGMAASLCRKHGCDPRGVYNDHLDELKALMTKGVGLGKSQPPQDYNLGGMKRRDKPSASASWRLELADGTVVVPTNAAVRGYVVSCSFRRADDGSYDYGPLTWRSSDTQEVRAVAWPIVTVPRTDRAGLLYSEVWGAPGNLRRPDWERATVGRNLNAVRDSPAFRFGALLDETATSWYLDSRETDLAPIRFFFRRGPATGTAEIEAYRPMPATIAGGRLVPFKGGWFEAATVYKAWAKDLPRTKAARVRDRSRLRDISMWFWNRGLAKDALPPVERFRRDADVGVALDWYWWHAIPYDSGYPNFWPPREGVADFRAAIARLRASGIYTQVYMNGMTWDMDDPSWCEGGLDDAILPLKAFAYNVYDRHRLADLCGHSPHFQARMSGNVRQLAESGLDGVYLDMISAASREALCRNPAHPHRPGDGAAQAVGWRRYLTELKRTHPKLHLSSEDAGEAYLDKFDSLICCQPSYERLGFGVAPKDECVPAFMAVYHDAVTMFGSYAMIDGIPPWDPKWPDKDRWKKEKPWETLFPDQFAVELSRGVVWGLQPTVHNFRLSGATDARYAVDYRFMVDTARFHAAHRDFLFDGEMRSPGVMKCATQTVDFLVRAIYAKEGSYRTVRAVLPTVHHSVWRTPDGRVAAVLVNWSRQAQSYELKTPDVAVAGTLPARTWRCIPADGAPAASAGGGGCR